MLKLMLIQRRGATTHKILSANATFDTVIELVQFENFERKISWDNANRTVHVPSTDTTYTMLSVKDAKVC